MIAVLDTNALVQIFGIASPYSPIRDALRNGRLELAVSTPILLEYEEIIRRSSGSTRWDEVWRFLTLIDVLHGTVHRIGPGGADGTQADGQHVLRASRQNDRRIRFGGAATGA